MNALPRISMIVLALSAPLACASDDEPAQVDVRDAQVGWQATGDALALAHTQLEAHYNGRDLVVDCPGGGSSLVSRETTDVGNFEFHAEFTACSVDDVTIDGDLTVHTAVAIDEHGTGNEGSIAVLIDYDGHLELGGSIDGACTVAAQLRGGAVRIDGKASAGARVDGTLCGHAADVVVEGAD